MAQDGTIKIGIDLDGTQAQAAMAKFGKNAKIGLTAVTTAVATVGTTLLATTAYAIKTGIEFESAFAGVKKTVNATDAELDGFRQGIRDMAKDIPQTAAAISEVAEAAGQLGIKNEYLLDFTETMSNMGVATNMSATEAATSLARLANITQMPQENFGRLGSTIVALGNDLATTESEITEMGLRLAGAGKQVGMTEAKILGLSGALSSVGIEADAGGSAMSTVMSKIQLAVEKGGESLERFADVAGMSSNEFQQAFKEDAAQAIVAFVTGLGTMDARGKSAIATLADMEITEIRQRDALLRLSGAGDILSESLGIATQAWSENNALTNEAEQRYQTLESRLRILKNNVDDFGISVYDSMRDPLKNAVDESIGYVNRLHAAFNSGGLNATVKELGRVFDDVTDEIAGTSKAAEGIITPLKNITSAGASLTKAVLPVMANGFRLTAENLDVLIPIVTSAVVGYKAFNKIGKTTSTMLKANAVATELLNKLEKKNALQLTATNGGLTIRQGLLAVQNKQITVTTALTGLWASAQNKLNAAMAANPVGVVVVAVAALAGGLLALKAATGDAADGMYELSKSQQDALDACEKSNKAYAEAREAREKTVQSIDREYTGYSSLISELESITDENGRVKTAYEQRAKVITGELSNALGTEIEMTDGVIQKYQETISTVKDLIAQKKAEALISSMQDDYADAYDKSIEAIKKYTEAKAALEEQDAKVEQVENDLAEAMDARASSVGYYSDMLEVAKEAQREASATVEEARSSMEQYASDVNNYNALVEASYSGSAEEIEAAISRVVASFKSYSEEALDSSQSVRDEMYNQARDITGNLETIKSEGIDVADSVYQEMSRAALDSILEFNKVPGGVGKALEEIGPEASQSMANALAQADLSGQLDAEAKEEIESFIGGLEGLDEQTKEVWSQALYGALEGLEGFESLADPAQEGADVFLESLKAALEVHSPSVAVQRIFAQVWPGASAGLEEGKGELNAKGTSVITSLLAIFGGVGEKAKGIGANLMSLFGSGITSQQETSRAAGKRNADAALTGAGSVKSASTGSKFASEYASGITSKTGEATSKGRALATNADTGAKSKSGYDAGSSFGSGFVSGIGNWIRSAASKAAELANNALNAARRALDSHSPSKKARKLGRTMPQGFGLGIEDDAKIAVKGAKELATDALDALDAERITERLKSIDVPKVMSRIYTAIDEGQFRVSERVTAPIAVKERIRNAEERKITSNTSEIDYRRLVRELSKRPIIVSTQVDAGEIARTVAIPMEDKIKENNNLKSMLKGERP